MTSRPRRPWLAAALSLFAPGLGHLYCGRPRRGAILLALSAGFVPAAWFAALPPPTGLKFLLLVASAAAIPLAILLAVADAFRIARRLPADFPLRRWQRPPAYAAFAVLCLGALGSPLLLRHHVIAAFRIATGSMEPALAKGDLILVSKLSRSRSALRRGDVIVFRAPGEATRAYVKRIAALAGDRVEVRAGKVLVNGEAVEDHGPGRSTDAMAETIVPAGHLFVLGDDLARSCDSRAFGQIPAGDVIGTVFYLLSPPRAGPFRRP